MKRSFGAVNTRPKRGYLTEDERWNAVVRRDAGADGLFFFSVKTTGVFCRPSCAARRALRKNVRFHETCEAAESAGFRACKRCQPNGPALAEQHAAMVATACLHIQQADTEPSLDHLAKAAGMSRFHFHRLFTKITGLTPKAFAKAHRAERARAQLPRSGSVTEAIYQAGFNSSGRFYEESSKILGMTPNSFRTGASGETIRFAVETCSLGLILVASSERGVCAVFFGDDRKALSEELHSRFPNARLIAGDVDYAGVVAKVIAFVEKPSLGLALPLDIRGTVFQQRVWQALRDIPSGATASYTEIACNIGAPKAVRAVASACAANSIAAAIPCHRVLRGDGSLSGYRWGVERKRKLLLLEKAV